MRSIGLTWENSRQDRRLAVAISALAAILAASAFYSFLPLALLAGVAASVYFISRPYPLLLVMVFLIPFNFVFKVGPLPVAAELLKVLAWIPFLALQRARKQPFLTSRFNTCFAILTSLIVLSFFRSNDLPFTIKESVRLASNIGLCYLVLNLVDTRAKVFQVFRVLIFSAFVVACYGFYQFAIRDYGGLFWIVNARMDTGFAPGRDTFWLWRDRITSVLTSELELGHYFNLCLPIGAVLWLTEGRMHAGSRWLWMTVAMLAGLLLTFTFGAWFGFATTTGLFVFMFDKKQRGKMLVVGGLILMVAALGAFFGPLRPILEGKLLGDDVGSLAWDFVSRLDNWLFTVQTWWSHPMLGVGAGNFQSLQFEHDFVHSDWAPTGSSPHETYLYLLVQFGVVGFVAVMMVMLRSIRTNLSLRTNPELGMAAAALAFGLTANMLGWFSDDAGFFGPHASYLVWLVIGLSEVIRNLALPRNVSVVCSPGRAGID